MSSSLPLDEPAKPSPRIDWASQLVQNERWLRTVIAARLGERQAVDDVWQEVSLAVVGNRNPPRDPSKINPWLYRLAVLQSLLYRRRQGRRRRLAERYARVREGDQDATPAADPLAWLLADERRLWVRQALERLPARDAEILLLKYSEDWSYQQLALRLGTSTSAVESRLHRARARLRETLASLPTGSASHARNES